ncbi:uncharacterized protein C8Q71DRAFT_288298 [Rhodofomes roseus]|uniref:Methyltransferase n=2 Tax=Rhodofomes roseus TaxID=34475 RepID=A0ABQ8K5Z6_9APHY|nr:uncharacterized protein C8Q71DRAFT_288298 [Rhodofomes roseus]KAH9831870.1 hypothetical protein C8Q71DRAFT_288298 [Rhodofomes roseus]
MSDQPQSVTADVFYFSPPEDGSKPYTDINADPLVGKRRNNWNPELHSVEVENLRGKEDSVTLDTAGFQFGHEAAAHKTFTSDAAIEAEYYPESIELVKKITGASRAVVFDHTIRRRRPGEIDDSPQKRQPVPLAHVDQTTASAIARVHRHLPPAEAPALLQRRFQIINLWRPISHPAYDWPLALCDYRSVDPKTDLVATDLIYPDRKGETNSVKFNPNHKWKYLRGMTPEEFVFIKCFDSKTEDNTAVLTPHTAFQDPSTPKDAPFRESIELRLLVFYD